MTKVENSIQDKSAFTLDVRDDGVAILTMDVPGESMNTLKIEFADQIDAVLQQISADSSIKGVVLVSGKDNSFVAGADISMLAACESAEDATAIAKGGQDMFQRIEDMPVTFVAAIHGPALGGGLELALACHFRVCSDDAKTQMGLPEVQLGLLPGSGGTQRLPQLVGKGRAMEMVMTAGMIDANTAKEYGLVNHVTTQEDLLEFCEKIASKIMRNSPVAIKGAIKAINANFKDGVDGYKVEIKQFGKCFGTEDFTEGTTAFLEKRKAEFPGK